MGPNFTMHRAAATSLQRIPTTLQDSKLDIFMSTCLDRILTNYLVDIYQAPSRTLDHLIPRHEVPDLVDDPDPLHNHLHHPRP